jgi:sulfate permease, SulP family
MGLFQIVLGLSGLVRLAKYVPQPVLAGFVNGVALLALIALLPLLFGWPIGSLTAGGWPAWAQIQPATLAVGVLTVAMSLGMQRLGRRLPVTLIGLLAGCAAYAFVTSMFPQVVLGPLTGEVRASWPHPDALAPLFTGTAWQRHGGAAVGAGLLMALIGTLELVLSGLAMDQARHTRSDPRREVLALGTANVASGLLGGLPLLLLRPRALHMLQVGGRSRTGLLVCCGLFAVLGLLATPLLALLPQVVLGGLMFCVYVQQADRWSLQLLAQWWRGVRTVDLQLALAVAGVVCITTVVLGFPAAVAVGALLSLVLFVRSMNRSLVRNRCTAESLPSRRIYAAADEARLRTLRARIIVLELEGALFFGSADRLAETADALDGTCHALVLDFRRVSLIDASGAVVLTQIARRLRDRGTRLLLAGISAGNRHGRLLHQFAGEAFAVGHGAGDMDRAIEAAEMSLLALAGVEPLRETVPLEQVSLMNGLDAGQRARLASCLVARRLRSGETLFRVGDPGDRLFVITAGSIDVFSGDKTEGDTLPQRFVSLSAGMMLGETAMLDGGGRSGDAVASGDTEVHSIDEQALQRLRTEDPLVHAQVHRNIAVHLSQRLRAAAWAWRASLG